MAKGRLPIDDFLRLNNGDSTRRTEIVEQMEFLRTLFQDDDEGWIKSCLGKLPQNMQEIMFICFILGAEMKRQFIN